MNEQFKHRFLLIANDKTGEKFIQPVFLLEQDITEGLPQKIRTVLNWPRIWFSGWLQMRMLVAGCSAGEGGISNREPWAIEALAEALTEYGNINQSSILLIKDVSSKYRHAFMSLSSCGFKRVSSMPGCKLELNYDDFDVFSNAKLGKAFRENLRRKFKALSKYSPISMEVLENVENEVDDIYRLYLQTYQRSSHRFERLTRDFFLRLGREMPDRMKFFIWRQENRIIGFVLCAINGTEIYDLNIGLDYSVALKLHLYFVTRRDILDWAMKNGYRRYHVGQLNYHPKLHFRMQLSPLDLYAKHPNPFFNPILKFALNYLQPARYDPLLQQFPNASEL